MNDLPVSVQRSRPPATHRSLRGSHSLRTLVGAALALLAVTHLGFPPAALGQQAPPGGTAMSDQLPAAEDLPSILARQQIEYRAETAKTIVELQPFRQTMTGPIANAYGDRGTATLINLNPHVNDWFLLTLRWTSSGIVENYHLENLQPHEQTVGLAGHPGDLEIASAGARFDCQLWSGDASGVLRRARSSGLPYVPLCGERLYLRNTVAGTFTLIERVTEVLRDHVWGGEKIVTFVREHLYRDAFAEAGAPASAPEPAVSARTPRAAQLRPADQNTAIDPPDLGIDVSDSPGSFLLGRWYPVNDTPGIFFSLMRPAAVPQEILDANRSRVNALDGVETPALDYLMAIDLMQFELHFALGTDHPRVGWSERIPDSARDPRLPGPDGIDAAAPLVVNGMVSPAIAARTVATFAAGFKREHGAFRFGPLALQNHGSHYGFLERGVVFSKLQPGLATLYSRTDGLVNMKTWTLDDEAALDRIADARQNGVPLIDFDPSTGLSAPGSLVNQWGAGNWSGSESEQLRTLRAGACLQDTASARFLIFGYFSTATPSAMTRVFQAYGCRYAMLLDMNALEHTYFALYTHHDGHFVVQHLIQGMAVVDRKGGEQLAPRFLGFPDDRDFFYVTRRQHTP